MLSISHLIGACILHLNGSSFFEANPALFAQVEIILHLLTFKQRFKLLVINNRHEYLAYVTW